MKKVYLTIVGLVLLHSAGAQDLHFSQTSQTPLLINPGAVGVFDGWERLTVNHRNQWLGASTQFMSTAIAADVNLGKTRMNDKAYAGLGVMFFNDIGGDSKFGNTQGSVTLSGVLPMGGSGHTLSAGIQGGFGQRKGDIDAVTFMSQWDGETLNSNYLSGEQNSITSFSYVDASAGLYYIFDGGQSTFSRHNDVKFELGVAGFHLNAPRLKYTNGVIGERLHRKFVAHARIIAEVAGSKWSVDGSMAQFMQGAHFETILGMMMRYRFEDGTKSTGHTHNAYLGFGSYFRWGDALVPSVNIEWRGFQFGVSYDVTVSYLRKAYTGSLEFSLSYKNMHDSLFKIRKRRF
ncbi:MAG: PorP/SprF family type IX secretion system membrane protein [Crocinitomicaceae bacterium]|nr:PorP/SprF family type IX secretion system membrane protein [Crocinitomicaceae bacterium]